MVGRFAHMGKGLMCRSRSIEQGPMRQVAAPVHQTWRGAAEVWDRWHRRCKREGRQNKLGEEFTGRRSIRQGTCRISSYSSHQMAPQTTRFVQYHKTMEKARKPALVSILAIRPLADVLKLVTWTCHWHCHIVMDCPVGIISWYWVGIFINQSHIS